MVAAFGLNLYSLEYSVGDYRLEINAVDGRFSLYYLVNGEYQPLFFSDNPRTSSVSLKVNDSVVRFGDEKDLILSIQEFSDGVLVQFSNDNLRFEEKFSFISDSDGAVIAMALDCSIINLTSVAMDGELRLIFDTTLGEDRPAHFTSEGETGINREYRFSPNALDPYIISSNGKYGLMFTLSGAGASPAREVITANWKRLSETPWEYDARESRNFNLLPFSINDSALAMYYGPESLAPQQTVSYRLYLSAIGAGTDPAAEIRQIAAGKPAVMDAQAQQPMPADIVAANNTEAKETTDPREFTPEQLRQMAPYIDDIETLNVLIQQIDNLLQSRSTLSITQIEAITEILETIRGNIQN